MAGVVGPPKTLSEVSLVPLHPCGLMQSRASLTELQRKLLDFTVRLQTCEEERQVMRVQMIDLNHELEKREEERLRLMEQNQPVNIFD
ncbi:hypothetical protein NDU88_005947 [Pleurodeles waltl]|uniref:Uncharacterized protein n=1 Tax=Pleurodeles waltl TaxID=8319 RepID=A0AAV7WZC4_PLEWA|nr:hypothetical protein NDU88_005947 [Pleurodeles waltl]